MADQIEEWACAVFGLTFVDESHYDAVTHDGTKVEIKACRAWIQNGYTPAGTRKWTRGRWKLWKQSHADLCAEDDRVYLLVVYDEDSDRESGFEVVAHTFADPDDLTEMVDEWHDVRSNPRVGSKGKPYRLAWSSVFDKEVGDGYRR